MTDERLIEEIKAIATKAALEVGGHAYPGFAAYDAAVLAATAVFEKAHTPTTPTDREREVLALELSAWKKHTGDTALANLLGRVESALHRSGVEIAAMTAEKEKWRVRCAEETIAWADEATENRRLHSEPQCEPSDAQVEAALQALGHARSGVTTPTMRAALRAASEAGGEGR